MNSQKFDEEVNKFFGPNGRQDLDFIFSQLENFKKGIEEMNHAREIAARRAAAAEEAWENQLNKIKEQFNGIKTDISWIYDQAKKPVKFFADDPKLTKTVGYTAAGASIAVLTALAYSNAKKIFGGLGKTGLGIAEGKALEAATGIMPVFVTNMPAGGILGGDNEKAALLKTGFMASLIGGLTPVLAGGVAYSFYKYPGLSGTHSLFDRGVNKFTPEQDKLLDEAKSWGAEHGLQKRNAAPMYYNDEYKRDGDKKQFVFNFKFDKNGRVIGDTNTADADFLINIARGDFTF